MKAMSSGAPPVISRVEKAIEIMILSRRNNLTFVLLLMVVGVVCVLLVTYSTAKASSANEPPPVGYHQPTGPELSPTGAAEAAIEAAREGVTAAGGITIRVAHGTYAHLSAVLDGSEAVSGPTKSGKASCFPGLPCTTAEVEEHEKIWRELDESSAYIVEMTGTSFSPPAGRVKRGARLSSGGFETVIVDAHTGIPEARMIGGKGVKLESLGLVTELTAVIPSEILVPAIPTVVAEASRVPVSGFITGRLAGLSRAGNISVVLLNVGGGGNPRDVHISRKVTTNARGVFKMVDVVAGRYIIESRPHGCAGKRIAVKPGKTTKVTLACTG